MPRPPRRPRPAPAQASRAPARSPSPEHGNDTRGRAKTRVAGQLNVAEDVMIRAANRNRDAALERLANKDATTTGSSGNEREASSQPTPDKVDRRGRPVAATPTHRRDTTGLDLADDSIFGDLGDSFADTSAGLGDGMRSTDTSALSMGGRRPRSRQSSFIGRNDPPIRPSSRGMTTPGIGSSFNIGAFRRRKREPSILGTARKPLQVPARDARATEPQGERGGETEDEEEGLEDFEPEAESTPVNNRRKTQQGLEPGRPVAAAADSPQSSSPRKRKSEDAHQSSVRPEKTARMDQPDEELPDSESELSDAPSPQPLEDSEDSDSELSDLPSPQEPPGFLRRPATPVRGQDDDEDDEVNAPPASSGSEGGDDVWPDIRGLAKKRRRPSITTPTKLDALSDISSPPSLTHSPNFEDAKAKASRARLASRQQQQASPKLTTADLTNLLPKRRYKRAAADPTGLESDEELDTAGLRAGEDELSYLDAQTARRRRKAQGQAQAASSARGGGRAQNAKQGQPSRSSSDKENDGNTDVDGDGEDEDEGGEAGEGEGSRFVPLADETFEGGSAAPGEVASAEELKKASRKFKEVDRWELEFEEVAEASSQDGR